MQQRMAKACAATAFTALGCVSAVAAVSVTSLGTTYTENFDTLAASGTSTALPSGWAFVESGTNANTVYTAGTGSSNTAIRTLMAPVQVLSARWAACAAALSCPRSGSASSITPAR